jgi:hypothetical protein
MIMPPGIEAHGGSVDVGVKLMHSVLEHVKVKLIK